MTTPEGLAELSLRSWVLASFLFVFFKQGIFGIDDTRTKMWNRHHRISVNVRFRGEKE